jgi:hypothetical protein
VASVAITSSRRSSPTAKKFASPAAFKRCCARKSAMVEVEKAEHDDTKSGNSLAIES